ncbi:hypothetical protein [Prevotella nigrescens]|uniref:hypothetical protein n=1 Tax=Prevotella nigrescens TaxID=28133 RepID=UPI001BA60397|nr:hypothetical protein [Prevotella nigrescens]QUB51732.1 hypothetical protein J5A59_10480 [Prevotella nigrescens]
MSDEIKMIGIQPISLFRTSPKIATGLRQLSLRSYGNRRYGVTAIVATELRQQSLRGYDRCRYGTDRHGCSPAPQTTVF